MAVQSKAIRGGLLAREWGQRNEEILMEAVSIHSLALIPLPIRLRFDQNPQPKSKLGCLSTAFFTLLVRKPCG
jgi:hypothetical protein